MNNKNLARRLERLEDRMLPASGEPLVIEVRGVDTDGKVVSTLRLTIPAPPRAATKTRYR